MSGMDDYSDMRQVSVLEVTETTLGDGTALDGIPHTVQVIAFSPSTEEAPTDQDGPASAPRTARPKPATVMGQPTLAVHADPGQLTAKWTKVEGATSYKVEWKESGGSYSSNRQASVTALEYTILEYTISGLSAANDYVVQVTAMNTSGSSAPSSESAALRPRPAQVTNLTVTAPDEGTGQRLVLSWGEVAGATAYVVECKLSSDAAFTTVTRTSNADAEDETITSLVAGELYIFRVKASHSSPAVEGSYSVQQTGRPRPPVVDPTTSDGRKQITVAWTAPQGIEVDNYRVEWKKTTGEDYHTSRQRDTPGTSTSYVIQGLELSTNSDGDPIDTPYTVRVRAIVNSVLGPAGPTAEDGGTALPPLENQVTGVRVTPGLGQLTVQWDRLDDARGYKVQWRDAAATPTQTFGDADREYEASRSSRSYTIRSLTGGIEYEVQVVAVLADDDSDNASPTATGTPMAATPGQVVEVKVAPSTSALVVTWKKTDGVTGYKVEWTSGSERREHDVETNEDLTDAFNEDSPSFSIIPTGGGHPALTGTRYTVRVQAVNGHATTPGGRWSTGVTSMRLPAQVELVDQDDTESGTQLKPGANSLTVAWKEVAGAHSYKVQWKTENLNYHSSRQRVLTNPMEPEYEIPNLDAGTQYFVQVTATNALGKDGLPSDPDGVPATDDVADRPEPAKVTGVRVDGRPESGPDASA